MAITVIVNETNILLAHDWSNRDQVTKYPQLKLGGGGGYVNHSLYLARKCVRIFVRGHYLFQDANSFPKVKLEENCDLEEQIMFEEKIQAYFCAKLVSCFLSFKCTATRVNVKHCLRKAYCIKREMSFLCSLVQTLRTKNISLLL